MFVENLVIDTGLRALALAAVGLIWVLALVRLVGPRSFSKMTAFDFVATVAIGSLLAGASQASDWPAFFQSTLAILSLLVVQWVIARVRSSSAAAEKIVSNKPVLLMEDGQILDGALEATRVARSDLIAKLREANVLNMSQVRAVVLETTGDISVLHGDELQDEILSGTERG